jgi:hypothetical protein
MAAAVIAPVAGAVPARKMLFISYSAMALRVQGADDQPKHMVALNDAAGQPRGLQLPLDAMVLNLADFINKIPNLGVEVVIDQYFMHGHGAPKNWYAWMAKQLDSADKVLFIPTPEYMRRVLAEETSGVEWEGQHADNGKQQCSAWPTCCTCACSCSVRCCGRCRARCARQLQSVKCVCS